MAWRPPNRRVYAARLSYYRQYISDDVAEFMAWRLPKTSKQARRAVRLMRDMVRRRYQEGLQDDPDYTFQDAIDDVTTDILTKIETGEEVDWALRYLTSP